MHNEKPTNKEYPKISGTPINDPQPLDLIIISTLQEIAHENNESDKETKLRFAGDDLALLNKHVKLQKIQRNPKRMTEAITTLVALGHDAQINPNEDSETINEETDKLFMESSSRIYPGIQTPKDNFKFKTIIGTAYNELENQKIELLQETLPELEDIEDILLAAKKSKINITHTPSQEIIKALYSAINKLSSSITEVSRKYEDKLPEEDLEIATRYLYQFKLIKASLEQTYNNSQHKLAEQEQKTRLRETLNPTVELTEQEQKTIDKILLNAGVGINTSILGDYTPEGNNGFQDINNRLFNSNSGKEINTLFSKILEYKKIPTTQYMNLMELMHKENIYEVIEMHPEVEPIYKETTQASGFWRKKSIQKEPTGEYKPLMCNEFIENSSNEPAIRVNYYITHPEWRDYSNRTGQYLLVTMVLPESIAKEAAEQIQNNPMIARTLAERFMKEQILTKNPNAWEEKFGSNGDSLKPPYERWNTDPVILI